jgi:hypothetical protein
VKNNQDNTNCTHFTAPKETLNETVSCSSVYSDFDSISISSTNVSSNKTDRVALNLNNNLISEDERTALEGTRDLFGNLDASEDHSPIQNFNSSSTFNYNDEDEVIIKKPFLKLLDQDQCEYTDVLDDEEILVEYEIIRLIERGGGS